MKVLSIILFGPAANSAALVTRRLDNSFNTTGTTSRSVPDSFLILNQSVIPKSRKEVVVRLHCFTAPDGKTVVGWLGCYRRANFPENPRGGVYVGAGLLVEGKTINIEDGTRYLLDILDNVLSLEGADSILRESVFAWDLLGIGATRTDSLDRPNGDVNLPIMPDYGKSLLKDFFDEGAANGEICTMITDSIKVSLSISSLHEYAGIYIVNSKRLVDSAMQSLAFIIATGPGAANRETGSYYTHLQSGLVADESCDSSLLLGGKSKTASGSKHDSDKAISRPYDDKDILAKSNTHRTELTLERILDEMKRSNSINTNILDRLDACLALTSSSSTPLSRYRKIALLITLIALGFGVLIGMGLSSLLARVQ